MEKSMANERKLSRRLMYALQYADEYYLLRQLGVNVNYTEMAIMYMLDGEENFSQKEIASCFCVPLSTVNTIIKKWENEGYVVLEHIKGKPREMTVVLTEKGKEYVNSSLSFIYKAEDQAIRMTIEKYSESFIDAMEYYGENIRKIYEEQMKTCNEKTVKDM